MPIRLPKRGVCMFSVIVLALGLLMVLIRMEKEERKLLGFSRSFLNVKVRNLETLPKGERSLRLCGITPHYFYFQSKQPQTLIRTDGQLKIEDTLQISVTDNPTVASFFFYQVDSPLFYLFAPNAARIFKGDLLSKKVDEVYKTPALFTRALTISSRSFVLKGFDPHLGYRDEVLIKMDGELPGRSQTPLFPWMDHDGGIRADGLLHYDSVTHTLVHVCFYSNQILLLDTMLRILGRARTIDPFLPSATKAKMRIGTPSIVQSFGKRPVNWQNCVSGGVLYNLSWVKADNEQLDQFRTHAVIDFYALPAGSYIGSFYLPTFKGEHLMSFQVIGSRIVAEYRDALILYELKGIPR